VGCGWVWVRVGVDGCGCVWMGGRRGWEATRTALWSDRGHRTEGRLYTCRPLISPPEECALWNGDSSCTHMTGLSTLCRFLLFSPLRRQVFREGARLVLTIASSVFVWAGVFQVGLPCAPPPMCVSCRGGVLSPQQALV
jgi:hypothetical protein